MVKKPNSPNYSQILEHYYIIFLEVILFAGVVLFHYVEWNSGMLFLFPLSNYMIAVIFGVIYIGKIVDHNKYEELELIPMGTEKIISYISCISYVLQVIVLILFGIDAKIHNSLMDNYGFYYITLLILLNVSSFLIMFVYMIMNSAIILKTVQGREPLTIMFKTIKKSNVRIYLGLIIGTNVILGTLFILETILIVNGNGINIWATVIGIPHNSDSLVTTLHFSRVSYILTGFNLFVFICLSIYFSYTTIYNIKPFDSLKEKIVEVTDEQIDLWKQIMQSQQLKS